MPLSSLIDFVLSSRNAGTVPSNSVLKDWERNFSNPMFSITAACSFEKPKRNDHRDDFFMVVFTVFVLLG
jgi:hypothetical protein